MSRLDVTSSQGPTPPGPLPSSPKPAVSSGKRIFKNTLMLYFRMLFTMGVSLYAVRIVLTELGVEDYGIYNVVGGIVALFSFLPKAMASATQRFFAFALGKGDREILRTTFSVNWIIYGLIAIVALVLLESVGLWFVQEHLKVPTERFNAALWLYHFSVLTFAAGIFTSPFMAIITAHEDMHIYAFLAIGEAVLKLGVVLLLAYLPWDKLELYGFLLLLIAVLNAAAHVTVCVRRYEECQFRRIYWDRTLLREIVGFTGWTLFGQLTTIGRTQAVTILLNQTFNPVVVAARAVATNIATQVNILSNNFNMSLYPPIVKSFASGDRKGMHSLIFGGSKITFFLMWLFALPLLLEMDMILAVWLKTPPEGTVLFARLALLEALINAVSLPLMTAARAPGKMAMYESVLGSIQIAIFLISWLVLAMGGAPHSVFIIAIVANVVMFIFRFAIVRRLVGISAKGFIRTVIIPAAAVVLLSTTASLIARSRLTDGLLHAGISVFASLIFSAAGIYFIGLDKEWRSRLGGMVINRLRMKLPYSVK